MRTLSALPCLFVPAMMAMAASTVSAQPTHPPAESQPIIGESLIIVVPASRDAVLAYSMETGRWKRQAIAPIDKAPILPIVSTDVGAVCIGNLVLAFSGPKGDWDSVTVSDASKVVPVLHGDTVMLQDGSKLYVFSANAGKWSGVDLETGKLID